MSSAPRQARRLPVVAERETLLRAERQLWSPGGWRANWHRGATVAGVLLALTGALLGFGQVAVPVGLDRGGYRVGNQVLSPAGIDAWAGDGAVVITHQAGATVGASAAIVHGAKVRGLCSMAENGLSEHCLFLVGSRSLTAVDVRQSGGWHRRYDNGTELDIPLVDGRPVPVPFAIGYPL